MSLIAVLGAGNSGLAMAGHLALSGHEVRLWNRTAASIEQLKYTGIVRCTGAVTGEAALQVVTNDLGEALDGVYLVLITTPASSHRDLAAAIEPHLTDEKSIVLNPGRTFGVIEFEHILQKNGVHTTPIVAEMQTIIHTCRKTSDDSVVVLALKQSVEMAARTRDGTLKVYEMLPSCIREYTVPAKSLLHTSLGNVGAVLHCAPVLLNAGWIENEKTDFKYYYDGITPSIARYLEKLDEERLNLARKFGLELDGVCDWMKRTYLVHGECLYECLQDNYSYTTIDAPRSLQHRYIYEDVPCGLVPYESLGRLLGIDLYFIPQVINLANELVGLDFRTEGRTLERVGLHPETAFEDLQALATS
jgi:opine dehydrogenase